MSKWCRQLTGVAWVLAWSLALDVAPAAGTDDLLLDTVELESGGEIVGKVTEVTDAKQRFYLVETADGGTLKLKRSQVRQIVRAPAAGPEYLEKLAGLPDTMDAHWEIQQWCLDNRLPRQREYHLMQVIRHEPDHTGARKRLGYTVREGVWVHDDHFFQNHGYVKDDRGHYRLPRSIDMSNNKDEAHQFKKGFSVAIRSAIRKYKRRGDLSALNEITSLDSPAAVEGLVEALKDEQDPRLQHVLIETLGGIKSAGAQNALVVIAMATDPSDSAGRQLGELCVRLLQQPHYNQSGVVSSILPFLSPTPETANHKVNKAAWLAGQMEDGSAVPALIDALVTTHKIPLGGPQGNINLQDTGQGTGFTFGNKEKFKMVDFRNQAVLDSLRLLTDGPDFQFDESAWLNWYIGTRNVGDLTLGRDD